MVYQTFLNHIKKYIIPYSSISSGVLFSIFNSSKTLAANSNPSVREKSFFQKYIIDLEEFKEFNQNLTEVKEKTNVILEKLNELYNFIVYLPENISQFSVDFLSFIFELITRIVLQTPLILFNNPYTKDLTFTFSVLSIFIVSILTMIESIKKMLSKFKIKHTDFKSILKRYAIAVTVSGFAPFLFEKIFWLLNKITTAILQISSYGIQSGRIEDYVQFSSFNTFILIIFDLTIFAFALPLLLQNGRRWFDILTLSSLAPLSLTAWIFDDYRHLYRKWSTKLKQLGLVQLVYATFITIMTFFIFGTRYITNGDGLIIKLLIIAGGLWRMLNPPSLVAYYEKGKDIRALGKDFKKTYTNAADTIKGKAINTKPIKSYISFLKRNFKKSDEE